jgi:hypothetical protein
MSSFVKTLAVAVPVAVIAVAGTVIYLNSTKTGAPAPQQVAYPATIATQPAPASTAPAAAAPGSQTASNAAPEPPPAPQFVAGPGDSGSAGATAPAPNPAAGPPVPMVSTTGAAQPPTPGPGAPPPAVPAAETTFHNVVQPYTLVHDAAVYVAASTDAPQMYPLKAGTPVSAVSQSNDGKWVISLTEDGQAAYLQTADLGPYDPNAQPRPDYPPTVEGVTQVIDTGTLTVNGQQVALAGIKGEGGEYSADLQKLISSQGGQVSCELVTDTGYLCRLRDGVDIARAGLYNGGAQLADDAPDDYRAQSAAAQQAHRGIWR